MTAEVMSSYDPEVTLLASTGEELVALQELVAAGQPLDGVHLRLHLCGSTLIFPTGVSEAQLRRLIDYADVLDWSGMERSN
jgi:hypothetical protein